MKDLTLTRPGDTDIRSMSSSTTLHELPGRAPRWGKHRRWFEIDNIVEVCEHTEVEWIPAEPENNVGEDLICLDCCESLPLEFDHAEI